MSDTDNLNPTKQEKAWLVVNTQLYSLDRIVTNIGRSLDNDIVIQDAHVSRNHAQIRYENDEYILYDMNSTGGTFLNNKKVDQSVLHVGNIITLTNVPMVFVGEQHNLKVRTEGDTSSLQELPPKD
ncbi:MAG: FHA domain-containing protein [Anaerolineae bacterium]|nr:FHA domain-containing protein [Anaerolineae bacterium]